MKQTSFYRALVAFAALVLVVGLWFARPKTTIAPTHNNNTTTAGTNQAVTNVPANTNTHSVAAITFYTDDLPDAAQFFHFSATLPQTWTADYNADQQWIVFADPKPDPVYGAWAPQVLVQRYMGTAFAAVSGPATNLKVQSKSAKSYTLTTDAALAEVIPVWKNKTYQRVDVEVSSGTAKIYDSFLRGPNVSPTVFQSFLDSLNFTPTPKQS